MKKSYRRENLLTNIVMELTGQWRENALAWRHKRSLPNVVQGASVLRVTGSMSVAGTDQKQYNKQWRFKKHRKRNKIILKMNPFNPVMFKKHL